MSEHETDDDTQLGFERGTGVLYAFGRQVKRFRMRVGTSREELGSATGYSPMTIAAFEQGRRIPPDQFIDKADEVLDASGVLKEMKGEIRKTRYPLFFRGAAKLESEAEQLHFYDTHVVNGLLQTEEYARCSFEMRQPALDEETIERYVAARMARQEIFDKGSAPLMSYVMEEVVLRRPIGGLGVMRDQLERILNIGRRRNVAVQVMPTDREEHAGLAGPFSLIETREGRRIAYAEVQRSSTLYTERKSVRELEAQYGIIRAQALTPSESMAFVERLLGET
ncbi:helix-turn-helix transcriptional regulator [Streptomyces sp. DH37]|uniref:helix-turn-helix domain-containing protein n=1 Tax=Streptomyces sp. DH37 TaxID=3040122 RepID=UPI002441236D|nr:helix-turn-helix transcriptional regulator [Streptomyces sp. DH37]MDG9701547.1 helix-turn-helix transcriptional regulator [Streptomyces sp. DH37]